MVELQDVARIVQGGRLKLTGKDFVDLGFPAYGAAGINGSVEVAEFDEPAVILSSIGARCGKCFLATGKWTSLANTQLIFPDHRQVDVRFLWYQLNNEGSWHRSGTGQPFIKPTDVKRRRVYLPPLPEQRRIAAILDHADTLRSSRKGAIALLDELANSVFAKYSARAERTAPLRDAYWFQEGPGIRKWQFTQSGVKLLNVGNIEKDGTINLDKTDRHVSEDEAVGRYKHFLVDAGDLVIASSGISFDDDGLLRTRGGFVEQRHLPLCMNTSTIRFKAIEGVGESLVYLQHWLDSIEFRSQITRLVTGTAQQNFGPSHLKQLTITLPPAAVQADFEREVAKVMLRRAEMLAFADTMDAEFAALQWRAFRGEL